MCVLANISVLTVQPLTRLQITAQLLDAVSDFPTRAIERIYGCSTTHSVEAVNELPVPAPFAAFAFAKTSQPLLATKQAEQQSEGTQKNQLIIISSNETGLLAYRSVATKIILAYRSVARQNIVLFC